MRPAGKEGATAVTAVTAVSKAEGVKADSTCGNAFKNNVEVGGVEPAASPLRDLLFWLVSVYWRWSGRVLDRAARCLSRPFEAFKPRHFRVT